MNKETYEKLKEISENLNNIYDLAIENLEDGESNWYLVELLLNGVKVTKENLQAVIKEDKGE